MKKCKGCVIFKNVTKLFSCVYGKTCRIAPQKRLKAEKCTKTLSTKYVKCRKFVILPFSLDIQSSKN